MPYTNAGPDCVDGAMIEQLRDLFSVVLKVTNLERAGTRV